MLYELQKKSKKLPPKGDMYMQVVIKHYRAIKGHGLARAHCRLVVPRRLFLASWVDEVFLQATLDRHLRNR